MTGANFTAVIVVVIRNSSGRPKYKLTRFEENKRERDKFVMQEGNDKMTDLMINRLIYRRMYESDRAWKTVAAARKGVKNLKYNKDKMTGLRDNIQIHYWVWEGPTIRGYGKGRQSDELVR